jgi:hypothetical protein
MISEIISSITSSEAVILLFLQLSAVLIVVYQKKEGRLGGPISGIKAVWLVYAITSWFGIPLLMFEISWVFQVLFLSMLIRGVVEVYLCGKKLWKTSYGLLHNGIQIACILSGLLFGHLGGAHQFWLWLLLLGFITEVIFVMGFRRQSFKPSEGVYFVPSGETGRRLNRLTGLIFAPQYVVWLVLLVSSAMQ